MAASHLTQTVIDAFSALADQVQALADHKIVLEHKLRFAHEQFQSLVDKYAPEAPEIAKTLAVLQPPSSYHPLDESSPVPILKRAPTSTNPGTSSSPLAQHQVALIIRDGRRAAARLVSLRDASKTTASTRDTAIGTLSQPSLVETSMPTTLEQDFTVEGRKGRLQCPFSKDRIADDAPENAQPGNGHALASASASTSAPVPALSQAPALVPAVSQDPKCPSLFDDSPFVNVTQAGKCPIRFMDERSPEEIAHYVEAHKHDLPRSHELCLRRYQRNEDQIKKLDSKYGNIVSMIEDLSQLHKPMLPEGDETRRRSMETRPSHDRVETWAQEVGASAGRDGQEDSPDKPHDHGDHLNGSRSQSRQGLLEQENAAVGADDHHRQGRFDRALKEVRVGESPSRPWGISVPFYDASDLSTGIPTSPPPAPVRIPHAAEHTRSPQTSVRNDIPTKPAPGPKKCPFDHTRLSPFANQDTGGPPPLPKHRFDASSLAPVPPSTNKSTTATSPPPPQVESRPAFIGLEAPKAAQGIPQMVFTGPVFIGYPMEQAIQFMNQYQPRQ